MVLKFKVFKSFKKYVEHKIKMEIAEYKVQEARKAIYKRLIFGAVKFYFTKAKELRKDAILSRFLISDNCLFDYRTGKVTLNEGDEKLNFVEVSTKVEHKLDVEMQPRLKPIPCLEE